MGRERVPERVTRRALADAGRLHRRPHRTLQRGLVQVVTPAPTIRRPKGAGRREHVLPSPVAVHVRKLSEQRLTQPCRPDAGARVSGEPPPLALDLLGERPYGAGGQRRAPILAALALPNDELSPIEIDILHPEPRTLAHSKPAAVHQLHAQSIRLLEMAQDATDLALTQHDGQPTRARRGRDPLDPREGASHDMRVQEQERGERLVLGRRRDLVLQRQRREETRDVRFAEVRRVAPAVLHDEPPDPEDVRRLGPSAVSPLP
jgi:hypothetical protein